MGHSGLPGQPGQAKGMLIPTEEWSLLMLGARMGAQGMFSSHRWASGLCSPPREEAELAAAQQQDKTLVAASQHQLHFMCTQQGQECSEPK